MQTIARHFIWYYPYRSTGDNDGHCQLCREENYPLQRRFKTPPDSLYRAIFRNILHLLQGIMMRLKSDMADFEEEGKNITGLQYAAEKQVHAWLQRRWRKLHKYVQRDKSTPEVALLTARSSTADASRRRNCCSSTGATNDAVTVALAKVGQFHLCN